MSTTQSQLGAVDANPRLFDDDEFFEAAARGELPEARPGSVEPDNHTGLGTAALPRAAAPAPRQARRRATPKRPPRRPTPKRPPRPATPARRPRETRRQRPHASRRVRISLRRPGNRVALGALAGAVALLALLVVLVAARGPQPAPTRARAPVSLPPVVLAPGRPAARGLDVVSPRLAKLTGASPRTAHLTATVTDAGAGVRQLVLLANGRRLAATAAPCRPACPAAGRFRFRVARRRHRRPVALALVAVDAAGNRALLWQRLLTPATPYTPTRLSAAFSTGRSVLTVPRDSSYALSGRLTAPGGVARARRRVEILALSRSASARPQLLASATTDAAGRWSITRLRARRGELLIARQTAGGDRAFSRALRLAVRSPLSARRAGGRVVGRLAPGARGVPVVLARRAGRRWRALTRARATADGRYRLRLPATGRAGGRLAVFAGESARWPFAPASRPVPTESGRR